MSSINVVSDHACIKYAKRVHNLPRNQLTPSFIDKIRGLLQTAVETYTLPSQNLTDSVVKAPLYNCKLCFRNGTVATILKY